MFVVGVNVIVLFLLFAVCRGWLGQRVDQLIRQTELTTGDQELKIHDFNETMTNLPRVPGEYP